MKSKQTKLILIFLLVVGLMSFLLFKNNSSKTQSVVNKQSSDSNFTSVDQPVIDKFNRLSQSGNSSCSGTFKDSISSMLDNSRLQGSCCSAMSLHRYKEQIEGLKKYKDISDIPSDPYDIEAGLAKKLLSYYDMQLNPEEQKAYDYAMQNSKEKGPCCCKCWRWYVYGGLGKLLIREKGFTGQQITEVWNLSDGCGGEGDHVNH